MYANVRRPYRNPALASQVSHPSNQYRHQQSARKVLMLPMVLVWYFGCGFWPGRLGRNDQWTDGDFDLVISVLLLAELEKVLSRPKFHDSIDRVSLTCSDGLTEDAVLVDA
jgi:hypothetical protein